MKQEIKEAFTKFLLVCLCECVIFSGINDQNERDIQ